MASTKIQEFDLDPNMDMAHESTSQEILGAVGNVAQRGDVQEILSKVANGVEVNLRTPVNVISGGSSGTVSGTGKGMLFLSCPSTSQDMTCTIDGTDRVVKVGYLMIEFSNSFSVTPKTYVSVNAVFY